MFSLIHLFLSPVTNGLYGLIALFIFVADRGRHNVIVKLITAIILYTVMWVAQAIYVAALYLVRCRVDPVLTDHVMELQDDGVLDITEFGRWHIFWRGIQRIVDRPGFVAIYIGVGLAFLIPKRAFTSNEAARAFIETVKARLENGR